MQTLNGGSSYACGFFESDAFPQNVPWLEDAANEFSVALVSPSVTHIQSFSALCSKVTKCQGSCQEVEQMPDGLQQIREQITHGEQQIAEQMEQTIQGMPQMTAAVPPKTDITENEPNPLSDIDTKLCERGKEYICGHCGACIISNSAPGMPVALVTTMTQGCAWAAADGKVQIRCECGGKHQDGTSRMHKM